MSKPRIRPYISMDLETTGLDVEKVDILELAAVLDDGESPIEKLRRVSLIIDLKKFNYSEPYALNMNARLIQAIVDKKGEDPEIVLQKFGALVEEAVGICVEYDLKYTDKYKVSIEKKINKGEIESNLSLEEFKYIYYGRTKVEFAGKNFAGFDKPVFTNFFGRETKNFSQYFQALLERMHYKTIDVGSMYYPDFGYNPSLSEINKITGRSEVSHQALDDALDVVYAVRHKMGML